MQLENLLPCPDGRLQPVLGRGDGAGPIGVVCAIGVIRQIEVDNKPSAGEQLRLEISTCSVRFLASERVREGQEETMLVLENSEFNILPINRKAEKAESVIILHSSRIRLYRDPVSY